MLKVDNIRVAYGPIEVLKGVCLEVPKESIVSLIGANGAGKTTILNTISGLLTPTSGAIVFQDQNIAGFGRTRSFDWALLRFPRAGKSSAT